MRRAVAVVLLGLMLAGCATFPDNGPREWREKLENAGELGGPPVIPEPTPPATPPAPAGRPGGWAGSAVRLRRSGPPGGRHLPEPGRARSPCCPTRRSALVAERATGRVLQVQRGSDPVLVATVPTDPAGGGGLTGLVLSPGYAEDQLVYAYVSTPTDNRVVRIAAGEPPEPVLVGIPRGASNNGGALGVDVDGSLLVATGDAGGAGSAARIAGRQAAAHRHAGPTGPRQPRPDLAGVQLRAAGAGRGVHRPGVAGSPG